MTINDFHNLLCQVYKPRFYGIKIIYYKIFPFQNKLRFYKMVFHFDRNLTIILKDLK